MLLPEQVDGIVKVFLADVTPGAECVSEDLYLYLDHAAGEPSARDPRSDLSIVVTVQSRPAIRCWEERSTGWQIQAPLVSKPG